ncbi:site-specific integrase [Bacteroides cellulosilyticus]|jgi:site-specific recombinase XerD|uniref:site-specific integrase n=1 Tax=Bacteroides TaxID=816 RepID=UPI00082215CC|nr:MULTISPECIES: site-specific integrase [Bacteroides]MCS3055319.1 site-specific integrase [Bacteroides cellulosilyticus]SCJ74947.1 Tyrosine recombinase XerD [uncultured Bacteroides sp.]
MKNIKIYLRKYNNDTSGIVWISFYVQRQKINFSTKVTVELKHWNEKKSIVAAGDKQSADKNLIIETILARINNVFVKYRLRDKNLSRDLFLREYNRPSDYATFFDFVRDYMKKISHRTELTTLNTHMSVIRKLKEFNTDLIFDDITRDWLDIYFAYLRRELDNNANTAYKNMAIIKKYVLAAYKAGYMTENPFEEWSIKKITSTCVYLNEEELAQLVALYNTGELEYKLHKTLEFFLFMCFSSLHVGDAKKLQLEQFSEDHFTYFRMKLRNSKPEPIQIPISDPLKNLLSKIVGTRKKGPLFEVIQADQTMNRNLKDIAAIAEIDKPITHKVGRHTFATIYLRHTKDLAALKELLGHSDMKETLVYAHVMDESKREGVQCFNSFVI